MSTDGREITCTVRQSAPGSGAITTPTGGSWPVTAVSFRVVAWHFGNENVEDDAGFSRSAVAAWDNIEPTDNDKITINWTAATRPPDHYSIYWMPGTTFTPNVRGFGTSNNPTASTTTLIATNGDFENNDVTIGDYVVKLSSGNTAQVTAINSASQVTHGTLSGSDSWSDGDKYSITLGTAANIARKVAEVNGDIVTVTIDDPNVTSGTITDTEGSTTKLVDSGNNFTTAGVAVGDHVLMTVSGNYAVVTAIVSATELTTAALTGSDTYENAEAYVIYDDFFFPSTQATTFVINPIKDMNPELRQTLVRAFNGKWVMKSYSQVSPVNAFSPMEIYPTSITEFHYYKIARWITMGTRIRLTESSGANALVSPMDGYFVNTDYWPSRFKNTNQIINLVFATELGTIS